MSDLFIIIICIYIIEEIKGTIDILNTEMQQYKRDRTLTERSELETCTNFDKIAK